jgi:hypothetical protein
MIPSTTPNTRITNTDIVLEHLLEHHTLTPVEALIVHKIQRLAPRIHELRNMGFDIKTVQAEDAQGTRYFRYEMVDYRFPA